MPFNAETFCANVSWEAFDELRKPDLMSLAKYFNLDVRHSMRKQIIKNLLIDHMVNEEIFGEECLENKIETEDEFDTTSALKLKQLEIQREIELAKLEFERKKEQTKAALEQEKIEVEKEKLEREEQERKDRLELEREKLEMEKQKQEMEAQKLQMEQQLREKEIEAKYKFEQEKLYKLGDKADSFQSNTGFDAAKYIRLVPKFQETEVDKYFMHFEKVAHSLNWPQESWTLLLQSVFVGKASEVYSSLSVDQCLDYEVVKQAILKAYELVPEAYRQRFRSARKQGEQTHVEFAGVQEQMLDRWLRSKEVNNNFGRFRQLILVEQFKSCVHADIKTHIDERGINYLHDAATAADEYSLTHKLSSDSSTGGSNKFSSNKKFSYRPNPSKSSHSQNSTSGGNTQSGSSNRGQKGPTSTKNKSGDGFKSVVTCNYCRVPGHLKSNCWKLLGKQAAAKQDSAPTGCTVSMRPQVSNQTICPKVVESEKVRDDFKPFVLEGSISLEGDIVGPKPIKIMRDTCSSQSMILEGSLPFSKVSATGENVLIQGIGMEIFSVPLHKINLKSELVSGPVVVGVRPELPVKGVSMLLGNDLAGGKVLPDPIVTQKPCTLVDNNESDSELFPACAVTRSMTRKAMQKDNSSSHVSQGKGETPEPNLELENTFMTRLDEPGQSSSQHSLDLKHVSSGDFESDPLSHSKLVREQENDPDLKDFSQRALSLQEADKVPVCFYKQNGVLMRKWRPPEAPADDEWQVIHQIVVPNVYHKEVISIAHDSPMAGHLGVRKTQDRILNHFWWPTLRKDVSDYCRTCHTCQVVGKPNQRVPVAPLKPIPAFDEPFSRVIVDCVGPLPKTKSGNQYLLTIMCASTRFPEAIPLRNIKAPTIVKALTKFFTLVGLPKSIQSDQGSNFMSGLFQQVMHELGIKQYCSSAYHPESQGALERFHQTLKNMIRTYCLEFERDWDEGVHLLLFAAREAVQETLGFSPFELVFGRTVRGPLKLLKEKWLNDDTDVSLLDYVSKFRHKLNRAGEIARENLRVTQAKMKTWYNVNAKNRVFDPGKEYAKWILKILIL